MGNGGEHAARDERGSATVVAAGVMVLALALVLATVDLLQILMAKSSAQTAADAAALAAVQEMTLSSAVPPIQYAAAYARANGASLVACECEAGSTQAVATVRVSVALPFLGGARTVTATARAVTGPAPP